MNNPKHYIACSGGKDSVAMGFLLEEKHPEINFTWVFIDSGIEFEEILKIVEKLKKIVKGKFLHLKSPNTWDDYFYKKREDGSIIGWPTWKKRWCNRILKTDALGDLLKEGDFYYLGIASNEKKRANPKRGKHKKGINIKYPLVEWNLDEDFCRKFCEEKGLLADTYEHFLRSACMYCPFKTIKELHNLFEFYPEIWKKMLQYDKDSPHKTQKAPYTITDLNKRFESGKIFLREPKKDGIQSNKTMVDS